MADEADAEAGAGLPVQQTGESGVGADAGVEKDRPKASVLDATVVSADSDTVMVDAEAGAGLSVQQTCESGVGSDAGAVVSADVIKEIFAAVVITFAQVPACVAFAALAKVPPIVGLHAAWLVGLPCAVFGGRPGMIVGSAGALASVSRTFMGENGEGIELLFASIIGAGLITCVAGCLRLGTYIGYVPAPVMVGFCNGLAIVIGLAQLEWFQDHEHNWLKGEQLHFTIIHALTALLLVMALPKFERTKHVPAHLIAVIVGIALEWVIFRQQDWASKTTTVGESFSINGTLPLPFFLEEKYDTSKIGKGVSSVFVESITLAIVMSLESLLTTEVVNDIADDEDVQSDQAVQTCFGLLEQADRQLVVLGAGNMVAGLFGTMGGTALIELSVMNVHAGGKGRISATLVPLLIMAIIFFASPILKLLPNGVLAGILIDAVLNTAKFESIPASLCCFLHCFPSRCFSEEMQSRIALWMYTLEDTVIVILVTTVTWLTNLAYGVASGMIVKAVISGLDFQGAETYIDEDAIDHNEASRIAEELAPNAYGGAHQLITARQQGRRREIRRSRTVRASVARAPNNVA